jgi:hypothetical protein
VSDPRKQFQRNIRIEPDLWAYVQSQAEKGRTRTGDCSAVIRRWIMERMAEDGTYKPQEMKP